MKYKSTTIQLVHLRAGKIFGCIALRKLPWAAGEAVKEAALLYHSYNADADADADAD